MFEDLSSAIKSTTATSTPTTGDVLQWQEELIRDSRTHQVIGRNLITALNPSPTQETFTYDPNTYHLSSAPKTVAENQLIKKNGLVYGIRTNHIAWNGENLREAYGRSTYYDGDGQWIASCPNGTRITTHSPECVIRINDDHYYIQGQFTSLFRLEGIPIAAYHDGRIHPLVTDHLGSVRAEFSPDGGVLRWARQYGTWGQKQVAINTTLPVADQAQATSQEKNILWSYAGLMEHPGIQSAPSYPLYWSQSRVYSSELHKWLSVDPLVKWNPKQILAHPGNWHALRYAGNQPLEWVDPSGRLPGDVWLYQSDGSIPGKIIHQIENIIHPQNTIYTHSSIEIQNRNQFTAHTDHGNGISGSWVIDSRNDILFNEGGNSGRKIDVYRHNDASIANINRMDLFANSFSGKTGHGIYGLTGVCSTATAEGLQSANLKMDFDWFPTPQSLSSDRHLGYIGTYNTEKQQSFLPQWQIEISR